MFSFIHRSGYSMTVAFPEIPGRQGNKQAACMLGCVLEGVLEVTGASAGWVGLMDRESGQLSFPACRGAFSKSWLTLQQGQGSVWGIAVREEPAVVNELPTLACLGEPPLRNMVSCPLVHDDEVLGHIVLANKAEGFSTQDALVLRDGALPEQVSDKDRRRGDCETVCAAILPVAGPGSCR